MTQSLQAVYENGVLRLLEPVSFQEQQRVTVTVSDQSDGDWLDTEFLQHLEAHADQTLTLEQVRARLAKISGSMTEAFQRERDERL